MNYLPFGRHSIEQKSTIFKHQLKVVKHQAKKLLNTNCYPALQSIIMTTLVSDAQVVSPVKFGKPAGHHECFARALDCFSNMCYDVVKL